VILINRVLNGTVHLDVNRFAVASADLLAIEDPVSPVHRIREHAPDGGINDSVNPMNSRLRPDIEINEFALLPVSWVFGSQSGCQQDDDSTTQDKAQNLDGGSHVGDFIKVLPCPNRAEFTGRAFNNRSNV
jgi:hypothetical protein